MLYCSTHSHHCHREREREENMMMMMLMLMRYSAFHHIHLLSLFPLLLRLVNSSTICKLSTISKVHLIWHKCHTTCHLLQLYQLRNHAKKKSLNWSKPIPHGRGATAVTNSANLHKREPHMDYKRRYVRQFSTRYLSVYLIRLKWKWSSI